MRHQQSLSEVLSLSKSVLQYHIQRFCPHSTSDPPSAGHLLPGRRFMRRETIIYIFHFPILHNIWLSFALRCLLCIFHGLSWAGPFRGGCFPFEYRCNKSNNKPLPPEGNFRRGLFCFSVKKYLHLPFRMLSCIW